MNKQIQWYPGHMFKSLKEIKANLKIVDILMILTDSRAPISGMNPEILKLAKNIPTLILLNKMDLSDLNVTNTIEKSLNNEGFYTLKIDAKTGKNTDQIIKLCNEILKDKLEKAKSRGLKSRALRAMIVGIPNVGKSTLINQLSKKKATKTADTPGVTKHISWIRLAKDFELLDTPGVLWPKFSDEVGYHLAITGAIKDDILPLDDIVHYALLFLQKHYLKRVEERYEINNTMSYLEMLKQIGEKRGAYLKNKEIDYERVYQIVLTDIRNNYLGGLTFDRLENV